MPDEPVLKAKLILNASGKPKIVHSGEHDHYSIELFVDNVPKAVSLVQYTLHPSYYDPVRDNRGAQPKFAEEITSYGDFKVRAKLEGSDGPALVRGALSDMLKEYHASTETLTPDIAAAIEKIAEN
ncbi:MAG: pYEATS domain-containing protein [Rhodospirillaceae bacterium]|nr:pYEATS domain-containing protein [Rhodospirillaceae bacterium]